MSDVKFVHQALEGASVTASAGSAAGYGVENLLDRNPRSIWRSGGTTNAQTVSVDLGAARAVDAVVIDGHNLIAAHGSDPLDIAVQYSTDNATWHAAGAITNDDLETVTVIEFASQTARYWRLSLTVDGPAFAAAPEIGNLFIGAKFVPSVPYDSQLQRGDKYATVATRALDGTPYMAQRLADGIEGWKAMKWTNIEDTTAEGFRAMNRSVRGSGRPFYFLDADGEAHLVAIVGDTIQITKKRYNINDVQMELQAFLPVG